MIFELAGHGPQLIQVTAQFSNAVLVALMPYFSDAAQKLDLPVPHPITMQQVVGAGISPFRYPNGDIMGAGIEVQGKNTRRRWCISYQFGHVRCVELRPSYFTIQDPDDLTNCYGKIRMTKGEAVKMARDTITKLGIPLEDVFAEQEPHVKLPPTVDVTNTLPYYRIEWLDPYSGSEAVDIGINADAKRVERIRFGIGDYNLNRPMPKINVPTPLARFYPHANPEYAWKLLPIVLHAVEDYSKTLGLPISRPLTTNQVARFSVSDNGGWPHSEVELSNGWEFVYRNSMVNGYYAPDNLFHFRRAGQRTLIKDYAGKWNLTEAQAIALVKRTLAKLNYPTNLVHMDFKPQVIKPKVPGIPRYDFYWEKSNETHDDLESRISAEVDADKGELKSLYFDNQALWHHPPKIDVPISLPEPKQTNASALVPSQTPPKPPPRPFVPFDAPK